MQRLLPLAALLPAPAVAHPGHLAATGGHDHWTAGIAIGIALGIAGWAALKGRKSADRPEADTGDADTTEPEEAPA